MKKLIILSIAIATLSAASYATNLVTNGGFDDGGNGWNAWAGGTYFYGDNGDTIASFGWWNGANLYQETGAYYEADTVYTMTVIARNGDGSCRGVKLNLQDVTNGWVGVHDETYSFPDADKGITGAWRTYTMTLDTRDAQYAGILGHKIAVAVGEYADTDWGQYGWLHLNNVSLEAQAVPEPVSLITLGVGAVAVLARRRRHS